MVMLPTQPSSACRLTLARQSAMAPPPSRRPGAAGVQSSSRQLMRPAPQCRQRQHQRRPRSASAAAGAGEGAQGWEQHQQQHQQQHQHKQQHEEDDEGTPVTAEEMAEAEQILQDFLEGMGAAGEISRPEDADLPAERLSYSEAVSLLGMAGWRLNGKVCPAIEELVTQLEGCWRSVLPEDQFGLYELDERFKYLDSLDPEGTDPFAFRSMRDPAKGQPGYPRLQIENRAYWSRAFRKLHIEVATRQDGLQVLHCVMYPRLQYDLPILSMDLVANDGRVSLAIVDPCPVSASLDLPPFYDAPVRELQTRYGLKSNREVPEWGRAIFSPLCVIMRPTSADELGRFLKYTLALNQMHVQIAKIAHPVPPSQRRRLAALHSAHERYCCKQLDNDKTRRVLEAAFGAELSEQYMREIMFDCEQLPAGA